MANEIAIVILNYKNWQDTLECLASIFDITYKPYRVIVVDNDSQNNSLDEIEKRLAVRQIQPLHITQERSEKGNFDDNPVVLIQSASNRGYAAGNNIGIRWAIKAGSEYVLILNNDTIVNKNFLEPLADFLDTHPDTAMVGPKILDLNGDIDRNCARRRPKTGDYFFRIGIFGKLFPNNHWHRRHYYTGEYKFDAPREIDIISGSCMLIRSEILKTIGLLDENTFLYLEEFIIHEKLRSLNTKTCIIPKSLIVHKGNQATKKEVSLFLGGKGNESLYYYLRYCRNYPAWFVFILMSGTMLCHSVLKLKHYRMKAR